jgi:hypothetical protein
MLGDARYLSYSILWTCDTFIIFFSTWREYSKKYKYNLNLNFGMIFTSIPTIIRQFIKYRGGNKLMCYLELIFL